ncbi:PorV/PorQ family protein [Calditrichota bacterium GD2]
MLRTILTIFLTLGFVCNVFAGNDAGMAFLKLPVDARSAAMGEAAAALANDASAVYWNPALLARNESKSLVLMHNAYLADIAQEFAAFQFASGKHKMAVALNLMNIPGIEIRGNVPTEEPAGATEAINLAASFSYARALNNGWLVGLTAKYLYEKYYLEDATGWAFDVGLVKNQFLRPDLDLGVTLQNLGRMKPLNVESTTLPIIMRAGLLYHTPLIMNEKRMLVSFDAVYPVYEEQVNFNGGVEVPVLKALYLRSGLVFDWETLRYSGGFGLNYKNYRLNYAFSPYPYDLGNSHRFSLSWQF